MRCRLFTMPLLLVALLLAVPPSNAADDDEPKATFPAKGADIPGPFHVLNITGPRKGRYHCLVCRNGLNPVACIFVRPRPEGDEKLADWLKKAFDEKAPLTELIKKLDGVADKNPDAFLGVFVVFLGEKEDDQVPIINKMEEAAKTLDLKQVVFGVGTEEDPKDWEFKKDFETAVLLYRSYKVEDYQTFAPDKLTNKAVDAIVTDFDKMVPYFARPGYRPKLKLPKQ